MHKIINNVAIKELFVDVRLNTTDVVVWLHLYRNRVNILAEHLRATNLARETFRRSVQKLISFDWAYAVQTDNPRSSLIVPSVPPDVEKLMIHALERTKNEVAFVGEWLMKCILDIIVDDHDFRDNARPNWLVSGGGSGRFELDRWYRSAKVACDFHGSQHYSPGSTLHDGINEFQLQQWRDNVKAGICVRNGVKYVEISAKELSFDSIIEKLYGILPLRPIRMDRPLIQMISNMCVSYANAVNREERRREY